MGEIGRWGWCGERCDGREGSVAGVVGGVMGEWEVGLVWWEV